jgi:peptidoglycan/xylan/chitin deacetylase (PgdA/CDA1 family)
MNKVDLALKVSSPFYSKLISSALMFHDIGGSSYNSCSSSTSAQLLNHFSKLDPTSKARVHWTFDDAFISIDSLVRKASDSYISTKIYVPTGLIGRELGGIQIAEAALIKEWSLLANVEIGSHGHSHTNLTRLTMSQVKNEVLQSKNMLEQLIGKKVSSFAFPRGKWNPEIIEILIECEFSEAWSTRIANLSSLEITENYMHLPRIPITNSSSLKSVKGALSPLMPFLASRIGKGGKNVYY